MAGDGRDRCRRGHDRGDRGRRRRRAARRVVGFVVVVGVGERNVGSCFEQWRSGPHGICGRVVGAVEGCQVAVRAGAPHQLGARILRLRVVRARVSRVQRVRSDFQPPTTGRKVVQGAQLNLTAGPKRIDDVAQEIYDVVGQANGIVENSSVTQGGPGAAANFQLNLPSAGLAQTMSQLSSLNYAQVVSRTDSSQDITDQYGAATRSLADARALRTSLLKQLANATTTDQVNSLNAQIHDAEAWISSDQATLNRLNHQVNFSQVYVTVQAKPVAAPVSHGAAASLSAVRPTMPARADSGCAAWR